MRGLDDETMVTATEIIILGRQNAFTIGSSTVRHVDECLKAPIAKSFEQWQAHQFNLLMQVG